KGPSMNVDLNSLQRLWLSLNEVGNFLEWKTKCTDSHNATQANGTGPIFGLERL
ncbi:hypothetical protein STEG23_032667, partial [Scotinomys teguina]